MMMNSKWGFDVVYVVLMMMQVQVVVGAKCIESERQALLSIKRGFNLNLNDLAHKHWLSSWVDGDNNQQCCCNWEGVKCSNITGHVVKLDLHHANDLHVTVASISPSLGELHHLNYLDLSGIFFEHTPSIPPFIASLTHLRYLNLSFCFSNAKIPSQLGNLLFLEYLDLGNNVFDHPQQIPSQFANLSRLLYLDLSGNELVGGLSHLTNMSSLRYLDLSDNSLEGTIPPRLGNLILLEHLDLGSNGLSGTIPNHFRNLSRLQYLYISHYFYEVKMLLSSDLEWLSQLSSLRHLSLHLVNLSSASNWQLQVSSLSHLQYLDLFFCNLLDYSLPSSSLGSPANISTSSLSFVDISYNSLKDSSLMFPWLMNSTGASLVTLLMNDNDLTGTIPEPFGENLSSLESLILANNELKGQIPASLFRIGSLTELDLSENRFTGIIPDVSRLSSLQVLKLDNNRLDGAIHEGIGQLSNLTELSLGNNLFRGLISEAHFSRLTSLSLLELSHNTLVFNVSDKWIPPFSLITINLAYCNLGPSFPRWLQTQNMIDWLDISHAGISSTVPNWFWKPVPQMRSLNLSHNRLRGKIEGPIPANQSHNHKLNHDSNGVEIDYLRLILEQIDLSFNLFEGPIPAFLSAASQVFVSNNKFSTLNPLLCANSSKYTRFMDLSSNYLIGELPDCWVGFELLVVLDLSDNYFDGNVPKSLGSLTNIQSIHFGGNNFSGEIPPSLSNCTELQVFDAADNKLSGTIPSWIGDNIPKLLVLSLHSNKFHGSIPLSMCNLYELHVLDLSLNILSRNIPKCISNLSAMAITQATSKAAINHDYHYGFSDHYNHAAEGSGDYNDSASLIWKGKMSKYGSTLGLLRSIDFSSNRLIGEIPTEIMSLVGLVSLNLSRNLLSGDIPPTIGQLKSIDFLDLSRNHLSGRIPSQLAQIDRLSVLDLSFNDLSGEIPLGEQLQTRDASAYAGNPKLCGAPLNNTCAIHGRGICDENDARVDAQFITVGFYIAVAVGFVMGFWGVCFSLIFKKSWRYAYFKSLSDVYDNLYVLVVIKVAKLKRMISQIPRENLHVQPFEVR
ncbi:hypothetical protein PIB30_024854 [Stylosanthes scabra]|uniref:Leucine-rich repeat-containing N-terminal plant-type domain-containing protein n=1 Tax=Stylosanthes scabra TaxID=79078 RepID=A0ABU6Z6L6_9FABA|nr:hypothetical protein [Stylosanthes scabra]